MTKGIPGHALKHSEYRSVLCLVRSIQRSLDKWPEACTYDCEHIKAVKEMAWPCQEKVMHDVVIEKPAINNCVGKMTFVFIWYVSMQAHTCTRARLRDSTRYQERMRSEAAQRQQYYKKIQEHMARKICPNAQSSNSNAQTETSAPFPPGMLYKVSLLSNRVNIENSNSVHCFSSLPVLAILRP